MNFASPNARPVFSVPALWAMRVLAWLAFGVTAYLAWSAMTQTSVVGCSVGGGCDAVLSSPWSTWLGIPVAVVGLTCYATIASLAVLLNIQSPRASRWITTVFVMAAILAAGASLWFIAIQVVAIGEFCPYCIAADVAGIGIGTIAIWSAARWWAAKRFTRSPGNSSAGLTALRSAIPTSARPAPAVETAAPVTSRTAPAAPNGPPTRMRTVPLVAPTASFTVRRNVANPSLPIAVGGALAMLLVLIGGQIVFPAKTYDVQQVALNDSIELSGANDGGSESAPSPDAETRVALRIPADQDNGKNAANSQSEPSASQNSAENDASTKSNPNTDPAPSETLVSPPPSDEPKSQRIAKFLNGKLKLDVYKHPLIGSAEAPHVVVEMVSYDCKHCRKMHGLMKKAMARYGNQVAIIVLPIPLEKRCNRLVTDPAASHDGACTTARMTLGIARIRPASFSRFHDWLMTGEEKPPDLDKTIAKAYTMADRTRLRDLRGNKDVEKQIAGYIELFDKLRRQNVGKKEFGLPIQILGDHIMSGSVEKADDIYKAWEEHLGVKPR